MKTATLKQINEIKGFFATFKELNAEKFAFLFGELEADEITALDNLLTDLYGNRILWEAPCNLFARAGAGAVALRYTQSAIFLRWNEWKAAKEAENALLADAANIALGGGYKKEVIAKETAATTSNTRQDKLNAYNLESEAADTNASEDSGERSETVGETRTTYGDTKRAAVSSATDFLSWFKNNDIVEKVMQGYVNILCNDVL